MKLYVLNPSDCVVEQRNTITQGQRNDGCYMVCAKNPPKDKADKETGGWPEGAKVPAEAVVSPDELMAISSLSKAHILQCIAFQKKTK